MGHGGTLFRDMPTWTQEQIDMWERAVPGCMTEEQACLDRFNANNPRPMHPTETGAYPVDNATGAFGLDTFHPPQGSHFDPSYEFKAGIMQQRPGGSVDAHGHFIRPGGRTTFR